VAVFSAIVAVWIAILLSLPCFGQVAEIFGQPEQACALLEAEGFRAGEWRLLPYGFECVANTKPRKAGEPPPRPSLLVPEGEILYVASGDRLDRVSRIKLVVQVPAKGAATPLLERFEKVASMMLERIGATMPKELSEAVREPRPFPQVQAGARITFDPGRSPHKLLTLIVRDPRVRVVTIPRVASQ
jgi:hypothetical protein